VPLDPAAGPISTSDGPRIATTSTNPRQTGHWVADIRVGAATFSMHPWGIPFGGTGADPQSGGRARAKALNVSEPGPARPSMACPGALGERLVQLVGESGPVDHRPGAAR